MNDVAESHLPLSLWRSIVEYRLKNIESGQKRIEGYAISTLISIAVTVITFTVTHGKVSP